MTQEEVRNMLVAKMICLTRETSGTDVECNSHNCENCGLNYEQGNMGEQKEALDMAIKALETQKGIPVSEKNCNTCGQKCAIKYHGCSNWIPNTESEDKEWSQ